MKFGILTYSSKVANIGDLYQLIGIRRVYERMGIKESDIIKINRDYLAEYDGEYVVLPLSGYFGVIREGHIFPLSPRIIPVFLGIHCGEEAYLEYLSKYRHFGPFGCRDEVTMMKLRQNGLDAYMSGCLSICAERRPKLPTQTKVFLVDISEKLRQYIPGELLKDAVNITHKYDIRQYSAEERERVDKEIAEEIMERYVNEAKLVITSRLHCALPCTAMGIPVIVGRESNDLRFSGMDKILDCYDESEFDQIDFHPEPRDIEWLKNKVLDLVEYMITSAYNKYSKLCDISQFYEQRKDKIYYTGTKDGYLTHQQKREFYAGRTFEKEIFSYITGRKIENLSLVIYGAGDKGKWMQYRYYEKMKKFKEVIIVDKNKVGQNFSGFTIQTPDILKRLNPKEIMIIVAADNYYSGAGKSIGETLINDYHFREGKEFYFLDKLNNSMNMPLDECGTVSWRYRM